MEVDCSRPGPLSRVDRGSNVLLQAATLSGGDRDVCPTVGRSDERNLLLLALSGDPERRLRAWRDHHGLPRKVAVLSADGTRTDGGQPGPPDDGDGTAVSTTTVGTSGDLTGIGIKLSQCLAAWEDEAVPTHVCLDSVTTLLQYGDLQRIFRFLNVVTRRVRSVGGVGHYHVDPGAHDARTLGTIRNLFDDVYEYDPDVDFWTPV